MGAPVLQFKRGQFSNLPGLRAGEPGFTTDKFDLYVGIDSTTSSNKFFGSHRYWNRETETVGSSVRVVEGSNNGSNYIELKSPNSLAQNVTYTLPATDVANGILVSDGSGNLSYTTTVTGSGSGLSAGTVPITSLDIDGGTDIGADLVDADLLIVDDGAGGTNKKTAMSRVKSYILGGGSGATFAAINVTGISTVAFADAKTLKVSGVSTFTGAIDANGNLDVAGTATFATPLANSNLANDSVSFGGVEVDLGASDATPAFNLTDATNYPTSSLVGTITNDQLAGSIANDKLANNSVSLGGISVALGGSDATPAFNLTDATNYPTSSLVGTITNTQLAGSIANNKLANSSVSFGGVSVALGTADTTPAFDLSDATNYPTTSLVGTITNAQLAGSIANDKLAGSIANNKLANSTVSLGGISVALGVSDATPSFNLTDATNYPTSSLVGTITNAQLAGSISDDKLNTITTANKVGLGALDIDGGTDIGADLADGDLIVVDDGAGGTNRKSAMSRVKSYVLGGGEGATFTAINVTGISTVAFADATTLKVSGVSTFTGTVDVNGAIDADGGANIAGGLVADTAKVSDLTDGRVVLAGTDGELEDSGNLTFNGSQLGVTGTVNASSTVTGSAFHTGAEGSAIRVTSDTISGPATITLDPAGVGDNTGKVVIAGDFQVDGTTTTVNSTTVEVTDKNILIANGAANDAAANGGGITIESGEGNKTFQFEATGDNLGSSENLNIASGKVYKVNNVETLSATTLGSAVVNSSLTNVGTLTGLTVSGNASIEGNVDLGNATSDTITATGRFDSDLVPSTDGARDLGTSDNEWQDLFIDGTANIDALVADSAKISDLTSGRVVLAGTSGEIEDSGNLTFDGSTLAVTGGATVSTTLDVDGQITSSAPLRNSTGGGLIPGVGIHSQSSAAGLVTAFLFKGSGLENFVVEDGIGEVTVSGVAATTFTTNETTTLTEGQTAITVSSFYEEGFVDVYLNGIRLITGTDYTETNDSTVTLTSGGTAGDEVEVVAWKSLGDVVNVNSLKTAGDLTVSGVATATGGFVGDLTGDVTGNITGDITGSLANATANTLPLGVIDIDGGTATTTLADADLFIVDDGANGTNRKVTFETISDAILGGSGGATFAAVNVTGIGTFGGIIDGNGGANISGGAGLVASSAKVSDLSAGRVVLAGTDGEIEDSGNLTFNGSKLTVTGNAQVTSDLDVDGGMNVSGGESVMSSATVSDLTSGRVVLAGTSGALEDSGNLTFNGSTLAITGAATVSSNLTVSGDLTVNGTTTQINTVNTTIEDTLLELQKVDGGNLGSDTNKDVGLVMNYYDGSAKKAAIFWDDSAGRFALASEATETTGVLGSLTYGGLEVGSLYLNDCAGASQVISCSGTTRSLENITIDGGSF